MKISCEGITTTDRYMNVHITVREKDWVRFGEVKVPLVALLQQNVTEAMDRTVRRALIQAWSEEDLADPLF